MSELRQAQIVLMTARLITFHRTQREIAMVVSAPGPDGPGAGGE
jgi:hypothetical protein